MNVGLLFLYSLLQMGIQKLGCSMQLHAVQQISGMLQFNHKEHLPAAGHKHADISALLQDLAAYERLGY